MLELTCKFVKIYSFNLDSSYSTLYMDHFDASFVLMEIYIKRAPNSQNSDQNSAQNSQIDYDMINFSY